MGTLLFVFNFIVFLVACYGVYMFIQQQQETDKISQARRYYKGIIYNKQN